VVGCLLKQVSFAWFNELFLPLFAPRGIFAVAGTVAATVCIMEAAGPASGQPDGTKSADHLIISFVIKMGSKFVANSTKGSGQCHLPVVFFFLRFTYR
jgi:hypothetical protein